MKKWMKFTIGLLVLGSILCGIGYHLGGGFPNGIQRIFSDIVNFLENENAPYVKLADIEIIRQG